MTPWRTPLELYVISHSAIIIGIALKLSNARLG